MTTELEQKLAAQAAVIDLLSSLLEQVKEACLFTDDDGSIGVSQEPQIYSELFDSICGALTTPTDSKQVLQEWLDTVIGEPAMTYIGKGIIDCGEHGHHNMEMHKLIPAGTKLFKKPEIK